MRFRRWQLRYQFSLKSMLAATALVALVLGFVAHELEKERQATAAVAMIRSAGGRVGFRGGQHGRADWLKPLLGDDRNQRVDEVNGVLSKMTDAELAVLAQFPHVRRVKLWETNITDGGLKHLRTLCHLEVLDLAETSITDAGLANLRPLSRLKRLDLLKTPVSDAGIVHLREFHELEWICLQGTQVTEDGAHELRKSLPSATIIR